MKGFCLLADTPGFYPDATAAHEALKAVCKILRLKVDLNRLDMAAEATRNILKSFGLISPPTEERKEESGFRWLI
jgi:proteasome assembly chaperone (PAC2) family protein